MSQESPLAQGSNSKRNWSGSLLIGIGLLWLLLAAALLLFQIINEPRVEINWETATEQDTVGFNVYRSTSPQDDFDLVNSDRLIDSDGGPVSGAQYTYVDHEVEPGETYFYVLEEIEIDGSQNRYSEDILQYSVPDTSWWAVGLALCSAIFGIVMLSLGWKERKRT